MSQFSDQEIDLRPYARALYQGLPWIILASILMGLAGYLFSGFLTPVYEASSLIALREPLYTLDFDARIQFANEDVASIYDALPIVATSDELLSELLQDETLFQDSGANLTSLGGVLSTEPLAKPSLIKLSATNQDPSRAADLVNAWSSLIVRRANTLFSGQGTDQSELVAEQLDQAEQELEDAEAELEAFAARNEGSSSATALAVMLDTQADYLMIRNQIGVIIQDALSLSAQLEGRPQTDIITPEERLAALLLQVRAFSGQSELPLQLQLSGVGESEAITVAEQEAFLAILVDVLSSKSTQLESELKNLTPEILRVQQEVQSYETEQTRLEDTVTIARDTHTLLAQIAEESLISRQDGSGVVQIASRATIPTKPVSPNKLINTIAAAGLGFLIAATAVLIFQGRDRKESENEK